MTKPAQQFYDQLDKLNDIASIAAVCNLVIKALDFDYEEERSGLHQLLQQMEFDIKAVVKILQETCK